MRKFILIIVCVPPLLSGGCIARVDDTSEPTPTITIMPTETQLPTEVTQEQPVASATSAPPSSIPTVTLTSPPPTPWPPHPRPMPIVYFIGFRTDKPPFDDVNVRRAFTQALDRQKLADDLWDNGSQPATSMVPPQIWPDGRSWYDEIGLYPGVSQDSAAPLLELDYDKYIRIAIPEGTERMGQLLREQWEEHLGIVVAIDVLDSEDYDLLVDTASAHMYFSGWFADYASPYNFLRDGIDYNNQWLKWSNNEYDQLIESAFFETDVNVQIDLYVQAERILTENDVIIAPLFHDLFYP